MSRVYKATIKCHHSDGTLVEPGLHYQTDLPSGGSEPDPSDVANDVWNQIGLPFQECTSADITVVELVVVEETLPPAIGVAGVHTVGGPGFLSAGTKNLPQALVPLVNFHTATRSRSARGHSFLGSPLDDSWLAPGGVWNTGLMGLLTGFANACLSSFTLGSGIITTVNPVVYSRTRHTRGQTPYTFKLTGATAKTAPTWLRSRGTAP